MIMLLDVTRYYNTPVGVRVVLHKVTADFPADARVGILAQAGDGRTSLVRLLAGIDTPNSGEVQRSCRVSWPIGYAGGLQRSLTADDNARIIARIFGRDPDEVSAFCHDFSELGGSFFQTLEIYSAGMRARLGIALSMAIDFDLYIADDVVSTGGNDFRQKCEVALEARLAHSGLILVSRNPKVVQRFCDIPAVLRNGSIIFCDSHDEAKALFEFDPGARDARAEPAEIEAESYA
jgi:capsular polysaccharide transport system ATP-binding protein